MRQKWRFDLHCTCGWNHWAISFLNRAWFFDQSDEWPFCIFCIQGTSAQYCFAKFCSSSTMFLHTLNHYGLIQPKSCPWLVRVLLVFCSVFQITFKGRVSTRNFEGSFRCESPRIFSSFPFILSGRLPMFLGFWPETPLLSGTLL